MMEREPQNTSDLRAVAPWLAIGGVLIALLAGIVVWQQFARFPALSKSTVTHSLVMQQIQNVAKLVTSEALMRDVVVFEDTWLGSTKRSLIVVTAKVTAGINLEKDASASINDQTKVIQITLPEAKILGVEITEMKTYDEQRGLWNPFEAADRDKIYQQARNQFLQAAQQSELTKRADENAERILKTLLSRDGYSVEVQLAVIRGGAYAR